jgi:hypothetical protein
MPSNSLNTGEEAKPHQHIIIYYLLLSFMTPPPLAHVFVSNVGMSESLCVVIVQL